MQNKDEILYILRRLVFIYLPRFIVGSIAATAIFLSYYFGKGPSIMTALDGCFIASMSLLIVGILSFITNKGFFDIFAYNGIKIKYYFNPMAKPSENTFCGTYDYTKSKEEKRKDMKLVFLSYIAVGLIYLIPTITIYAIYKIG